MMKGGHGQTNQLHNINWGALNHASRAPQLVTTMCVRLCVSLCVCMQMSCVGCRCESNA